MNDGSAISPEVLLRAYATGVFPMAQSRSDPAIHWINPVRRGIIPLAGFHVSASLSRQIRREVYGVRIDTDFAAVLDGCSARAETWINPQIRALYLALHRAGHAHSVEAWQGDTLAGGVYGVVLGGAFFGESMFSRRVDASKVALAWLVHRLRAGGFTLFDTQFQTPHLASLGAIEVTRAEYQRHLALAIATKAAFRPAGYQPLSGSVASTSP